MRRIRVLGLAAAALAALAALALAACGGGGSGEPIKIGVNLEMSGPSSVLGQAYVEAVKLRAREINQQGGILGRPIELVIKDNRTDQTEALTIAKQLADRDKVVAMIGPGTSPTTLAAMSGILQSKLPTISMGSSQAIVVPAEERPNVFKTPPGGDVVARAIVNDLRARGLRKVGFLSVNNPYGEDGLRAFTELDKAGAIQMVASEKFEAEDSDVTPQLRNLLAARPDALVVWAIPPGAPTVRRNAVERLNIKLPMYFDSGAGAEIFIKLAGSSADGALIANPRSLVWDQVPKSDPSYQALQQFGRAITKAYGNVSGFHGYAWDALGLLKASMEKAGSTDPQKVIDAFESQRSYVGVSGTLSYSPDSHSGLGPEDVSVLEVRNGKWVLPDRGKDRTGG
jgi:branched-chain amino acid transport system substrate-binding protein